jgi:Aspartyl protease
MSLRIAILAMAGVLSLGAAAAAPLVVPFDFSRHAVGMTIIVKGKPLYVLLDTGVNPSVIDLKRAKALGLELNFKAAGEGNGEGGTTAAIPSTIPSPQIGGRSFAPIDALATDMSGIAATYGRSVDGVLGYSFLARNAVLIDYPQRRLTIAPAGVDLAPQCRTTHAIPFASNDGDQFPVMRAFRFGGIEAPVTLDTGSNRTLGLYQAALQVPAIRKALVFQGGEQSSSSFGGGYATRDAILNTPLSIGPFALPAGQKVSVMPGKGIPGKRIANAGNLFLAALKARLLVDYPRKRIVFFGDCAK